MEIIHFKTMRIEHLRLSDSGAKRCVCVGGGGGGIPADTFINRITLLVLLKCCCSEFCFQLLPIYVKYCF